MSNLARSASRAERSTDFHACFKTPRDRLARLTVISEVCPQVVLRVLGLIAQQGRLPLSIAVERRARSQQLIVVLDDFAEHQAAILVEKVRTIVMVRSARLSRRARRHDSQARAQAT